MNSDNTSNDLLHKGFELGIIIKGIDSILEVIGGILLVFLNPARMDRIVAFLTQHELSEDPHDIITGYLLRFASDFSVSSQHFGMAYLITHGSVKAFLVFMVMRKKIWAYPLTVVFLAIFVIYEIYRFTVGSSIFLLVLSLFDFVMILLIAREYRRVLREAPGANPAG